MTSDLSTPAQRELCNRFDVEPCAAPPDLKLGLARNVREGLQPINGLRHPPGGDTTGWYIWAGERLPDDPDFFEPAPDFFEPAPLESESLEEDFEVSPEALLGVEIGRAHV